MELRYKKSLRLYLRTQYNRHTERKLGKGKKNYPRGHTEVGTFAAIIHRKGKIDKPGHAK